MLIEKHSDYLAWMTFAIKFADLILVGLSGLLAHIFYFKTFWLSQPYIIALLLAMLSTPFVFTYFQVYKSYRGQKFITQLKPLYGAMASVMFLLIALGFITKSSAIFSRFWFCLWAFNSVFLLTISRIILRKFLSFLRKKGWNHRTILLIGNSESAQALEQRNKNEIWSGFKIIRIAPDPTQLKNFISQNKVDEIWLATSEKEQNQMKALLAILNESIITIRYFPEFYGLDINQKSLMDIFGLVAINLISSPMFGINRILKAMEDRFLAVLFLILASPAMLLIASAIKLTSKGPVFYRQQRHGWDGKPFSIYKFRSMRVHQEPKGQVTQATAHDTRITPVGKLLRKTSLDELPQFINVLQGRMSIVGPRPHAVEHDEIYKRLIPSYMQRHQVKPGITGWAQINGWRGETDTLEKMQKRVEFDLNYIRNWSLWFDLKIILLTLFKGLFHKNAY